MLLWPGVSPTEYFPVVDAYTHEAPTIDTELYMQFLYKEVRYGKHLMNKCCGCNQALLIKGIGAG